MRAYPTRPETDARGALVPPIRRPPTAVGAATGFPPPPPPRSQRDPLPRAAIGLPSHISPDSWFTRHTVLVTILSFLMIPVLVALAVPLILFIALPTLGLIVVAAAWHLKMEHRLFRERGVLLPASGQGRGDDRRLW